MRRETKRTKVKSSFERVEKGLYYSEIIVFRVDEALKIPRNSAEVNVVQKVTSSTRDIRIHNLQDASSAVSEYNCTTLCRQGSSVLGLNSLLSHYRLVVVYTRGASLYRTSNSVRQLDR